MDKLIAAAGQWRGTTTLQDPGMNMQATTSDTTAAVTSLMDGRFVRIDYTWSHDGKPQWGSMLVGHRKTTEVHTIHWIDSFHNGSNVMACEGSPGGPEIAVRGSYAAPPGPDWGWRIDIDADASSLKIVMHNVSPEGIEELAVESRYSRA